MALKSATIDLKVSATEEYTLLSRTGRETVEKILKLNYPAARVSWQARATLKAAAADATFGLTLAQVTTSTAAAGASQVETLTAAGAITATGNLTVTVTAAGMTGSPLAVSVPVVNGDSAATWAGKVRTALAATAALTALYTVGGTGTAVTLTRKTEAANDATLEVAVAAGTAANASLPVTSANTTAGVAAAGTVLSGTVNGEIRGEAVSAGNPVMVLVTTTGTVQLTGPTEMLLYPDTFALFGVLTGGTDLGNEFETADLVATADEAAVVDVVVFTL